MDGIKKKRSKQLGMNPSTAQHRLRKMIMFNLANMLMIDYCHHCDERIENIEDFSIEHKIPWLDSEDPVGLFFDLDNIAFSHLKCNSRASRRPKTTKGCWYDKTRRGPNKYRAVITIDNKPNHIGWYKTEKEANEAYLNKRKELLDNE